MDDPLVIAGREFRSRLITGTGKYPSMATMRDAVVASGCELVSVAETSPPAPPPDTPPGTVIRKAPRRETKRDDAGFRFKATERGSRFECSRDHSPYRPCEAPKRYRHLAAGRHVFKVRAADVAGNVDPTTASYHWRVLG